MSAPTWFDEAMRLAVEYAISHSDLTRSRDAYSLAAMPRAEKALRIHLQARDVEFEQNRELALKVSGALALAATKRSQPSGWRPMGESPVPTQCCVLFCDRRGNRWIDAWPGTMYQTNGCGYPPESWMPLPAPPSNITGEQA